MKYRRWLLPYVLGLSGLLGSSLVITAAASRSNAGAYYKMKTNVATIEPIQGLDTITAVTGTIGYNQDDMTNTVSYTASASNPITWSLTTNPSPDQITIDASSGKLQWDYSLTPNTYDLVIQATDAIDHSFVTKNVSLKMISLQTLNNDYGVSGTVVPSPGMFAKNAGLGALTINADKSSFLINDVNVDVFDQQSYQWDISWHQLVPFKNSLFETLYLADDSYRMTLPTNLQSFTLEANFQSSINQFITTNNLSSDSNFLTFNNIEPNHIGIDFVNDIPTKHDQIQIPIVIEAKRNSIAISPYSSKIQLNVNYQQPVLSDITFSSESIRINNNTATLAKGEYGIIKSHLDVANADYIDPTLTKTWSLNNAPNSIGIDDESGKIIVTGALAVGNYTFNVICHLGAFSKEVSLQLIVNDIVPESLMISGDDQLQGIAGKEGYSKYFVTTMPDNSNNQVVWSLVDNNNNAISINDQGLLAWNDTITQGTYNLTIKATSVLDANVFASKNATLNIAYASPSLGQISLSGPNVSNNNQITSTYGNEARIQATCQINNNNYVDPNLQKHWFLLNAPSGVSIDANTGILTVASDASGVNNYSFSIIYLVGQIVATNLEVTITINYANPILGNLSLEKLSGQGSVSANNTINLGLNATNTFQVNCDVINENNTNPNLSKTYSLLNAPSGVSIDSQTGILTISQPSLALQGASFQISVSYGGVIRNDTYTLNIDVAAPILGEITFTGDALSSNDNINLLFGYSQTVITCHCEILNTNDIDPSLPKTWSLENAPTGVSIDASDGNITISQGLSQGHYNLKVLYQVGSSVSQKTLTINVNDQYADPILEKISISNPQNLLITNNQITIDLDASGEFLVTCNIINQGLVDPNLVKQYELENNPSQMTINAQSGLVTISPIMQAIDNLKITIKCHVGNFSQTADFYFNVINNHNEPIVTNGGYPLWLVILPWVIVPITAIVTALVTYKLIHRKKGQD